MDLKSSSRRIAFVVAYITIAGSLWVASQWWEKGLATKLSAPRISPNGCYRIESFKPFWVLPDIFHPRLHPDELDNPEWFPWWGLPGFYRLYDQKSGELIGESNVFDLESASGPLDWGDRVRQEVSAGMITIGPNKPDCIGDRPARSVPYSKPEIMAPLHGEFLIRES
ncbi:hypothetical protein D9M71_306100 [compost metagenome]